MHACVVRGGQKRNYDRISLLPRDPAEFGVGFEEMALPLHSRSSPALCYHTNGMRLPTSILGSVIVDDDDFCSASPSSSPAADLPLLGVSVYVDSLFGVCLLTTCVENSYVSIGQGSSRRDTESC